MLCKDCLYWNKLQSDDYKGVCKNKCGKVFVKCKETENIINENIYVITNYDFDCKSKINKKEK